MATTVDLSDVISDFPAGIHTSDGVAVTDGYAVIPVSWSNVDGYPEISVEQSIDDTDYYPAMVIEDFGIETPIKIRANRTDEGNVITVDNLLGDTPYVRIKISLGGATGGNIEYEINVG